MTATRRETGMVEDRRQARPGMLGKLKPGGFGTMTAIQNARSYWRREASQNNGLTGDCRYRYRQDGKSSRNMCDRQKTTVSGTSQVDFGGAPVSVASALIATYDAKHARDMDSSRLRYDDRPSESCRAADRKTQQGCRVAGLAAAALDARLHMRQGRDRRRCRMPYADQGSPEPDHGAHGGRHHV